MGGFAALFSGGGGGGQNETASTAGGGITTGGINFGSPQAGTNNLIMMGLVLAAVVFLVKK